MRGRIPALLLFLFLVLAAAPFWSASFLASYDGPLHLFRLFALDLTLRQGVVYPRTLLDLAFGYGYPIFNYYPPFAAYLGETLHLLGLGFAEAIKAAFTLGIAAALAGAYLLARDLMNGEKHAQAAALLTAAAYVFFPYFFVGLYTRGSLAENLAQGLLPWLFWSLRRLLLTRSITYLLSTALGLAMLVLAHSMTALLAAPALLAFAVLIVASGQWTYQALDPSTEYCHCEERSAATKHSQTRVTQVRGESPVGMAGLRLLRFARNDIFDLPRAPSRNTWHWPLDPRLLALSCAALSALLGLGLSAFYWLPFVTELRLVRMGQGLEKLANIFETNFLNPAALVQSSWLYEYGGPPVPLGLTSVVLALVALGGLMVAGQRVRPRTPVLFFGALALIGALAVAEPARDVWLAVPLATMIQSVWRVELLINLGAAIAIGSLPVVAGAFWPARRHVPPVAAALTAVLLILAVRAKLAPVEIVLPGDAFNLAHLARFEISGASPGTTTFGEYMPVTAVAEDLVNYRAPADGQAPGPAAEISLVEQRGARWVLSVNAPQPVSILLRLFYLPERSAAVDGQPARVYASTGLGLATIDVPAGNHRVELGASDTPVRRAAIWISGSAALVMLGLLAFAVRRQPREIYVPALAAALPLVVFALPAAAALAAATPPLDTRRATVSPALDLIGLTVDGAALQSGEWRVTGALESLHVRTYWQVKHPVDDNNPFVLRLLDDAGRVRAVRSQRPRYGTAPPVGWMTNEVVPDEYDLPLAAGIAPGRYTLQISVDGRKSYVPIGTISLPAGSGARVAPAPTISHRVDAVLGNRIRLLGYDGPTAAHPGATLPLTLYWQAERDVLDDYTASVQLLDPSGRLVAQRDSITGEGAAPSSLWIPGRPVVERRPLALPRELQPGRYTLLALMYRLEDMQRLPVVTEAGASPDRAAVIGQVEVSGEPSHGLLNLFAASSTP